MAYAAVVSLAQTTHRILNHGQYDISVAINQAILSIRDDAISLKAFLEDFREQAISLERRITEVANKAEDIIEYLLLKKFQSDCGSMKSTVGPSKIKFQSQMRKFAEKMRSIVGEMTEIKNRVSIKDVPAASASSSSTLAPAGENVVVGFDDDLMKLKHWLCGQSEQLQILPIVGTGGIGKTTLARNVYHDPLIKEEFPVRAWVTVSQEYSAEDISSVLLDSLKDFVKEGISGETDGLMAEKVYRTLMGRRYLIVMDDMWSTNTWDGVKMYFPEDHNGSRIMLTTRLLDVATDVSPYHLHEMQFMNNDQSWNLLRQKVFKQDPCPLALESIGKKIAENCKGLPLAIVVIAGLLSSIKQTEADWQEIAENINLAITANDEKFAAIFSLSYIHLPYRLRPCFLYMAGFPEDHEIRVSKLIKLWVAEGFVEPSASKTCEESAEECLEEIVKRNLVLVTKRKSNGKIKSCGLHDLLRDLCLMKALEEKFLVYFTGRFALPAIFQNQRRISIGYSDCLAHVYASTIRTIICYQHSQSPIASFKNCRLLRILDMVKAKAYVNQLPAQVFELYHLRYLALNSSICISATLLNLQNLQTLIIRPENPYRLYSRSLPVEIWRLPQLRHLIIFSFQSLPHPDRATFPLQNLQTLSLVADFICSERILKMIPKLKKLGICYFEDKFDEDCHLDNLQHLQLKKLKLEIHGDFPLRRNLNPIFPKSLEKLTLSGCRLPWEDMTIVCSLPNLEVLKLRDLAFQGDKWVTAEEFTRLKVLLIDNLDLQCWETENSHFPGLKCLLLHRCPKLSKIPEDVAEISALEIIEVDNQLEDSAKQIQEKRRWWGYDDLQVRIHMLFN